MICFSFLSNKISPSVVDNHCGLECGMIYWCTETLSTWHALQLPHNRLGGVAWARFYMYSQESEQSLCFLVFIKAAASVRCESGAGVWLKVNKYEGEGKNLRLPFYGEWRGAGSESDSFEFTVLFSAKDFSWPGQDALVQYAEWCRAASTDQLRSDILTAENHRLHIHNPPWIDKHT